MPVRTLPAAGTVAPTAYLTAVARAAADPSTGFRDPFAARFAAACPPQVLRIARRTAGLPVVVARSASVDRMVGAALCDAQVCVNLGAGFDARPYRMAWPAACPVIEVDTAAVNEVKERLLPSSTAPVAVRRLSCDIGRLDELAKALGPLVAGRRALVISEGLLPYLPDEFVAELARMLRGWAAYWITDVLSAGSAQALTAAARAAGSDLRLFGLPDLRAVEGAGWRCIEVDPLPTARPATARRTGSATAGLVDAVLGLAAG